MGSSKCALALFQDFRNFNGGSWTRADHSSNSSSSLDRKMWLSPRLFRLVLWGKLFSFHPVPLRKVGWKCLQNSQLLPSVLLLWRLLTCFIWSFTYSVRHDSKKMWVPIESFSSQLIAWKIWEKKEQSGNNKITSGSFIKNWSIFLVVFLGK